MHFLLYMIVLCTAVAMVLIVVGVVLNIIEAVKKIVGFLTCPRGQP